jgi:hypothetical protein
MIIYSVRIENLLDGVCIPELEGEVTLVEVQIITPAPLIIYELYIDHVSTNLFFHSRIINANMREQRGIGGYLLRLNGTEKPRRSLSSYTSLAKVTLIPLEE